MGLRSQALEAVTRAHDELRAAETAHAEAEAAREAFTETGLDVDTFIARLLTLDEAERRARAALIEKRTAHHLAMEACDRLTSERLSLSAKLRDAERTRGYDARRVTQKEQWRARLAELGE